MTCRLQVESLSVSQGLEPGHAPGVISAGAWSNLSAWPAGELVAWSPGARALASDGRQVQRVAWCWGEGLAGQLAPGRAGQLQALDLVARRAAGRSPFRPGAQVAWSQVARCSPGRQVARCSVARGPGAERPMARAARPVPGGSHPAGVVDSSLPAHRTQTNPNPSGDLPKTVPTNPPDRNQHPSETVNQHLQAKLDGIVCCVCCSPCGGRVFSTGGKPIV